MVETDGILALGFDGYQAPVSGSSYATARVTALAACLLAAHPDWSVATLRARIFGLAGRRARRAMSPRDSSPTRPRATAAPASTARRVSGI